MLDVGDPMMNKTKKNSYPHGVCILSEEDRQIITKVNFSMKLI